MSSEDFHRAYSITNSSSLDSHTPPTAQPQQFPIRFVRKASARMTATWLTIGAVCGMAFACFMFVLHLFFIPGNNPIALHTTTTMPSIMAVFAGLSAWSLFKTPTEVRVWPQGIEVLAPTSTSVAWSKIKNVFVGETANGWGGVGKTLELRDHNDKPFLKIPGALDNFDELVQLVKNNTVSQPTAADSSEAVKPNAIALKRGRRRALLSGVVGLLMAAGAVMFFYDAWWKKHCQQQMATNSVVGSGKVVRHFIAPNGVTRRIEYSVQGETTEASHNVEVERTLHDSLVEGADVPIRYVPADPRISELVAGEIRDSGFTESALGGLVMGVVGSFMSLFLIACTVMFWKGYDLKSSDNGLRFVPLG